VSGGRTLDVIVDGLTFPEGPRWHDGRLWFSDIHVAEVISMNADGSDRRVECTVVGYPSGLGWDRRGRLLIASVMDRRLLRRQADGSLSEVADLSGVARHMINDMVVDGRGNAYIGDIGFELGPGMEPRPGQQILVTAAGAVRVAADDLMFPNGSIVTPDGTTTIIGESFGGRLSAFTIRDDGSLIDRRVWAQLPAGAVPDGSCFDAEGCVWTASPTTNEVLRIREGGAVVDRVSTGDRGAYACMLGGRDRTTLFVCTARTHEPTQTVDQKAGRIEAVEVDVPGAGWP